MIDVVHIIVAVVATAFVSNDKESAATCKSEFSTFYGISFAFTILGYMAILRLLYLIFPHLIGYKYFGFRQRIDNRGVASSEQKELDVYKFSHSTFTTVKGPCMVCNKGFEET